MICTPETNFCRVFELPQAYPNEYCFGGGIPVTMRMVDWFSPVADCMQDKDWDTEIVPELIEFLVPKNYTKPGRNYLVLTDWGASFTFSLRPRPAKYA